MNYLDFFIPKLIILIIGFMIGDFAWKWLMI